MPHNKPESRFVQRVNSREGCWYHSWQDHDPSLMLSKQIKCQDVTLPLLYLFSTTIIDAILRNKPESCFVQRVNSREGCWYHSRQGHDPISTMSNQMKWDVIPNDVKCGMAECWIWWEWTLFWYVRVHMNKNTFHIDSYLLDRIRTCLCIGMPLCMIIDDNK